MNNVTPIELHRSRDFSKKINDTFEFIRQNIKSLGKSILFISGPPVLIASLMIGSFMGDFLNISQTSVTNPDQFEGYILSINFWLQFILATVFFLVSGVATIATVNNYIILYNEKKSNKIEVNEVWDRVRQTFWMYLGTMIFFTLLLLITYVVMIIPVMILAAVSPFLIFFAVVAVFCLLLYVTFGASLTFFIRAYEKTGFFNAIRRSFYLVRGKWWSTFGLIMVLYMIMMTISYIFIMPWYLVTVVSAFHEINTGQPEEPSQAWQVLTIVFFSLYYLVQMILYSLPNIGIAFQYFNLVELKEATGLMSDIQSLGETRHQNSPRDEQY